ncbi:hypothetical protein KM043_004768 [Ampulex compressa]|nr:hypothetical protein KM043_004768 [Ampulex compressa]
MLRNSVCPSSSFLQNLQPERFEEHEFRHREYKTLRNSQNSALAKERAQEVEQRKPKVCTSQRPRHKNQIRHGKAWAPKSQAVELARCSKRREATSRTGAPEDAAIDGGHPVVSLPGLVAILSPWKRKKRRFKDMSIRVSGVYLVPGGTEGTVEKEAGHHHHHHGPKTVTIVAGPQRSNSLDYLNFEEKRQIIASSLSLSDFLAHGPAAAAAAAKEVAATTVIGESGGGG